MRSVFAFVLGGFGGCIASGIAAAYHWPAWALLVAIVAGGIIAGTIVSMTAMFMARD